MTNEELKKKIVDVLRENIEYELHYFPDDNYTEVEFDYDKLADALIAAGIGDVKEAELERKAYEVASNQYRIWFEEQKDRAEVSEKELELHKRALCRLAKEFVKIKGYEPFEASQLAKEITVPKFLQEAEREIQEEKR